MWQKLLSCDINGKILNVIKDMYSKTKSCIKKGDLLSDYFPCNIGVRQGDNLSPLLFALFINDFKLHISKSYKGLSIADTCYPSLKNEDIILMKLFVLLYADDTIVLAENEYDLQMALKSLFEYCVMYNLTVNTSKTKIIIFSRGMVRKYPSFQYGSDSIEVVSEYVYLGVKMAYNNKFSKAMKKQLDQGRRSQFSMLIKAMKLDLPIDIQSKMFENVVFPVLLYGSEVWVFQSVEMLEVFHRNVLKKILKLRPSTPNCMVYGEVGALPLQVSVDKRVINYWLRLLNKKESTFSYIVYNIALKLFVIGDYRTQWLCRVKCILDSCGLSYIWDNQREINTNVCRKVIHRKIEDILSIYYTPIGVLF